ncbi:MAG: hypothetical protein IT327_16605 [Anaerolineae bacterium]|nr:hypothetical protein [Anaerolineae bacterium]
MYPTMELRINEKTVATFTNVQGDPAQRVFQAFTYTSSYWPIDVTTVKVAFVNDSGLRDLYVDKIVVGGVIYETEAPTTYSTGTYTSGTGCDDAYKQSEVLGCNGYFQYSVRVQRTNYSLAGQAIGLRIVGSPDGDNGLYYMHTDHLGSTSTLSYVDPVAGTAYRVADSRALYEPFGDYRLEPTGEYTDRGYTGHLGNNSGSNDIGLIYMNARYYVPGVARFASADTIVPDPASPQSFNRYSYVRNNPVNLFDPSGHAECGSPWEPSCRDEKWGGRGKSDSSESFPNYPKNYFGEGNCEKSLPECFGDTVYLKDFPSEQISDTEVLIPFIPIEEFEALADKIAEDLYTHDLTWPGFDSGRKGYDTPFYNGGGKGVEEPIFEHDQLVCVETLRCSGRSEINYIAQGLWGAAVGESELVSVLIVRAWKWDQYQETPSEDTIYWLKWGYEYYESWDAESEE